MELIKQDNIDLKKIAGALCEMGYERSSEITSAAFDIIGGTLSIYPVDSCFPVRIDTFGPIIERIYGYDPKNGKKISDLGRVKIPFNALILIDGSQVRSGEIIVHEDYGIGLFKKIGKKNIGGKSANYIFLEYRNNDMLYLPERLKKKLSPYIGFGRRRPPLSRLGSQSWVRTFKKTYENIIHLAQELLLLYAVRSISKRPPWQIDKKWDELIIKTFPHKDTDDQVRAISETFFDLKKEVPMDRLICGDVGFGKTEVAIRAAAQAISNNYQVAMLAPTTILVEQHYLNFRERFRDMPVVIERLSRFINLETQKDIIERIKRGSVDILIGTQRLFSREIGFKNLGLYIIDEEQKFGVGDKEKLKRLRAEIDVLSLTATPIPRTLFLSLSGIRDISQISAPPPGRKEIATEVSKYDRKKIIYYLKRELERQGQIYYLYNEIETISGAVKKLERALPRVSIAMAHGQMPKDRLSTVMKNFAERKIKILVCSTIIENGLDLPNVNTLIVERADKFGLSQLHQIRGRIGRGSREAHALFMHGEKNITANAAKRLKSLGENTALGSGFNIALSDLEIRGGGNILGREQHGNMEAVGLVLYTKLLKKAVEKLQGEEN